MSVPWGPTETAAELRAPTDTDDKYRRGVVGIRTGSEQYPGAAVLGVEAAWRTGVGMVRYLGPDRPTGLVLHRRPETVTSGGRVQAWLIGSGTDAAARPPGEVRCAASSPAPSRSSSTPARSIWSPTGRARAGCGS